MIPYEKVMFFKYTKSAFKAASTSWENLEECVHKNLFTLDSVTFHFVLFY
jgi:hypothetical protein